MLRRIRLRDTDRLETSSEPDLHILVAIHLPQADFGGNPRHSAHRKNNQQAQQRIDEQNDQQEHPCKRPGDQPAHLLCPGQGHRKRHRNDLGADDLVELPAKAVLPAICGNHRLRSGIRRVVAAKAILGDDERMGQVQDAAAMGFALGHQLGLGRIIAEIVDNVGFPIGTRDAPDWSD